MTMYPNQLTEELEIVGSLDPSKQANGALYLAHGLTVGLAQQLIEKSREEHIVETCPNDSAARFADLDAVQQWQAKGRLALPLVRLQSDKDVDLAGFGWMGPGRPGADEPSLPGAHTTYAMRLYRSAVGRGYAFPYARMIVQAHDAYYGSEGIWLEAWADNIAAIRTYEKIGFLTVAETDGLRHGKKIRRIYMMLGRTAGADIRHISHAKELESSQGE